MRRRFWEVLGVMVCAVPLLAGASRASAQTPQATPGVPPTASAELDPLKERVLAYWQARIRQDYRAQYDLLEPRARAVYNPEEYGRGRQVSYVAAQVEDVEARGNFARARVRLLVRVQLPRILPRTAPIQRTDTTTIDDVWVRVGGAWYRTLESDAGSTAPWPAVGE
jgi:hypothetical protein